MLTCRILGTLLPFAEAAELGTFWAVADNNLTGYDALNILQDGDYLFVEDGNTQIEWEGAINLNRTTNLKKHPYDSNRMRQLVNDCVVNGIQEGVNPERWLLWFLEERPAVLIRRV